MALTPKPVREFLKSQPALMACMDLGTGSAARFRYERIWRSAETLIFSVCYLQKIISPEKRHSFFGTAGNSPGESSQR